MIVAAILAKNEGDRYLKQVLQSLVPLTDMILVLDDGSTDNTVEVAIEAGAVVKHRATTGMWGNESPARKELWDWGSEVVGDGWLLIADADQELVAPREVWRGLATSWCCHSWAFPLYDCWDSPQQFRIDGHWQGYRHPRPWLFRPSACPEPVWNPRGIHTGHAPANFPGPIGIAPKSIYWKHYGWMDREVRKAKMDRYLSTASLLTTDELAHLHSAGDS